MWSITTCWLLEIHILIGNKSLGKSFCKSLCGVLETSTGLCGVLEASTGCRKIEADKILSEIFIRL